ncbi:hypothetical protein BT96DRAFT_951542 [Gymnopus androsaceus JB14]|uniref:Uncharacterized protein n=1 Tax=Gymnopus androsaceus JB14 TaxID=1447944 RepID=A0A6A4GCI6_9AGAR|nr:hypothetical protein BT96DRAFT_951542 [Gymnopus androsaceus JB14]
MPTREFTDGYGAGTFPRVRDGYGYPWFVRGTATVVTRNRENCPGWIEIHADFKVRPRAAPGVTMLVPNPGSNRGPSVISSSKASSTERELMKLGDSIRREATMSSSTAAGSLSIVVKRFKGKRKDASKRLDERGKEKGMANIGNDMYSVGTHSTSTKYSGNGSNLNQNPNPSTDSDSNPGSVFIANTWSMERYTKPRSKPNSRSKSKTKSLPDELYREVDRGEIGHTLGTRRFPVYANACVWIWDRGNESDNERR